MLVRYAGIDTNDIVNGKGFCVSFWTQYCPNRCLGCHNPETWSKDGGILIEYSNLIDKIINAIKNNNIIRNFSILGGEPLCKENMELVDNIIKDVKKEYPNILIYCWTGYNFEDLIKNKDIKNILNKIDFLIDGKFILSKRDVSLNLRGSTNQRIINIKESFKKNKIILENI